MINKFFFTSIERLGEQYIYPFHLYIFNPIQKRYLPFLEANCPLTPARKKFLEYLISRGGKIAIREDQRITFERYLTTQNINGSNLQGLDFEIHREIETLKKTIDLNAPIEKEFQKSLRSGDFMDLINRVKFEILSFQAKLEQSELAKHFALNYLNDDRFQTRVSAVAYVVAKKMKRVKEEELLDIFIASVMCNIGMCQVRRDLISKPFNHLDDEESSMLKLHPQHSLDFIQSIGIDLSKTCERMILEHHERWDGSGYPAGSSLRQLHPLSLVLAASTHFFEFSFGLLDGKKSSIEKIIQSYKDRIKTENLDFEFSFPVYQAIIKILTEELELAS